MSLLDDVREALENSRENGYPELIDNYNNAIANGGDGEWDLNALVENLMTYCPTLEDADFDEVKEAVELVTLER